MTFSQYLARQLGNPSGLVGRVLAPMWNKRNRALQDAALSCLALNAQDRVLEVGCGGGSLLSRIAAVTTDGTVVGVDLSPVMISYCGRHYPHLVDSGRLGLICASAESMPFPDGNFTKICTVNSVFYWRDVRGAFAEFSRLLEASGTAVVCFTCKASLEKKRFAQYLRLYEPEEILDIMATCGFQNLSCRRSADRHREFACITGVKGPSAPIEDRV
jgi:arsenite methyltransferase